MKTWNWKKRIESRLSFFFSLLLTLLSSAAILIEWGTTVNCLAWKWNAKRNVVNDKCEIRLSRTDTQHTHTFDWILFFVYFQVRNYASIARAYSNVCLNFNWSRRVPSKSAFSGESDKGKPHSHTRAWARIRYAKFHLVHCRWSRWIN